MVTSTFLLPYQTNLHNEVRSATTDLT
uniref:Uncharacterized protein n=1 Tax=Anguilla anguilla TaxID=7936 RepID=A0A0E9QJV2_ANGAN